MQHPRTRVLPVWSKPILELVGTKDKLIFTVFGGDGIDPLNFVRIGLPCMRLEDFISLGQGDVAAFTIEGYSALAIPGSPGTTGRSGTFLHLAQLLDTLVGQQGPGTAAELIYLSGLVGSEDVPAGDNVVKVGRTEHGKLREPRPASTRHLGE